jgi:hexosaminidase
MRAALILAGALALSSAVPMVSVQAATARSDVSPAAIQVIPRPVRVVPGEGRFTLAPGSRIVVAARSERARPIGGDLAALLRPATGFRLPVVDGDRRAGDIELVLGDPGTLNGDPAGEGYQLTVTTSGVTLQAPAPHGLFNGVQTIRQLLPGWIESPTVAPGPWSMPAATIVDFPRYPYRGLMLDIARHFQTPAAVEKLIDQAAAYKINWLHLHVADDQGFRVAIDGFPNLTAIGARGAVGTGGRTVDPGGFWTQEQYRSVVAHAAARFMAVVPEVDSPGHDNAIIMSEFGDTTNRRLDVHPQDINCSVNHPPVWDYTQDVGISALCLNSRNTWAITSAIVRQLSALTPGSLYDLGGDEVPASLMSAQDYPAFVDRESGIVQAQHKIVMGWADIAAADTHLSGPSVAEYWQPASGSSPDTISAVAAARRGMRIVMAPADRAYLDQKYVSGSRGSVPASLGQDWACPDGCDVDRFYNWDPGSLVTGVGDRSVIGVEGTAFSETLTTLSEIDYMVFPRLPALAEVAWSRPADRTSVTSPAYLDFVNRLAAHGTRFMAGGQNFHPSADVPWGLNLSALDLAAGEEGRVRGRVARLSAPGFPASAIRATIDWGDGVTTAGAVSGSAATDTTINGLYAIAGSHTYGRPGVFEAVVTASGPNTSPVRMEFEVRVRHA